MTSDSVKTAYLRARGWGLSALDDTLGLTGAQTGLSRATVAQCSSILSTSLHHAVTPTTTTSCFSSIRVLFMNIIFLLYVNIYYGLNVFCSFSVYLIFFLGLFCYLDSRLCHVGLNVGVVFVSVCSWLVYRLRFSLGVASVLAFVFVLFHVL